MAEAVFRSRFVMAGRVRTHYVEAGQNGPTVVLIHGGGPGSGGEAGFAKLIPLLADDFTVFAPDGVGGYGETDPYAPCAEGVQSRVDQLEAWMDALCLDDVCLAGNSMGAWVAAKYTLEHPDRVRRLFLIASNTIAGALGLRVAATEAMAALRAYDGSKESMRRVMGAIVYDRLAISDELIEARNAAANRPGAAEAAAAFARGQARLTSDPNLRLKFEMKHTLPRLSVPAVFAWGEDDAFAPANLGRQVQAELPNIPFHFIPRAGHQVQTDRPEEIARLMRELFLS